MPEAQRQLFDKFLESRGLKSGSVASIQTQQNAPNPVAAGVVLQKPSTGATSGAGGAKAENANGLARDWREFSERGTGGTLPMSAAGTLAPSEQIVLNELERAIRPYDADAPFGSRGSAGNAMSNRRPPLLFARSISSLFEQIPH